MKITERNKKQSKYVLFAGIAIMAILIVSTLITKLG